MQIAFHNHADMTCIVCGEPATQTMLARTDLDDGPSALSEAFEGDGLQIAVLDRTHLGSVVGVALREDGHHEAADALLDWLETVGRGLELALVAGCCEGCMRRFVFQVALEDAAPSEVN